MFFFFILSISVTCMVRNIINKLPTWWITRTEIWTSRWRISPLTVFHHRLHTSYRHILLRSSHFRYFKTFIGYSFEILLHKWCHLVLRWYFQDWLYLRVQVTKQQSRTRTASGNQETDESLPAVANMMKGGNSEFVIKTDDEVQQKPITQSLSTTPVQPPRSRLACKFSNA